MNCIIILTIMVNLNISHVFRALSDLNVDRVTTTCLINIDFLRHRFFIKLGLPKMNFDDHKFKL